MPMADWGKDKFSLVRFRTYVIKEIFPLVNEQNGILREPGISGWHSYSAIWIERKDNERDENKRVRFSIEICFYKTDARARITLRGGRENYEKKDKYANEGLKKWVRETLANVGLFRFFKDEYSIAHSNKDLLLYSNGIDQVTKDCKKLIDAFAEVSRKMDEALSSNPQYRISSTKSKE